MNTKEITHCIRQDLYMRETCVGCFPSDMLPQSPERPLGFVANTDASSEPGTHWVAVWLDGKGSGEYFDSYAQPPSKKLEQYLESKTSKGWKSSPGRQVQEPLSTVCGQYCLYFLYYKSRGMTPDFTDVSDTGVAEFVNRKFALDLDVYDMDLLVNQICKELAK